MKRYFNLLTSGILACCSITPNFSLSTNVRSADHAAGLAARYDRASAAAQEALNAANKGVAREKGTWWPEVDFVYNSQYSDVGFDNLVSPPRSSETYSISVRYPLFEGGAASARLRAAWAEYYGAQQQLEAAKRAANTRARAAWLNFRTASERISAARQAVKTSEVNLEAAQESQRLGMARITDVLLALAQNTRSNLRLSEAKFQLALSWVELELATGQEPQVFVPALSRTLHGG